MHTPSTLTDDTTALRLPFFPIAAFAIVMGVTGLALAWGRFEQVFALSWSVGQGITVLAGGLFITITLLYSLKLLRHRSAVIKELRHPVKLNFFPAFSISLILLATATLPLWPELSRLLWMVGSALHLLLTLYVMNVWMHHEHFQIQHINPAWFIPVVGNILVPIAGTAHGFYEISWFFFSLGLLFWLVLLTIFFYRVIFHNPLPQRLLPTLFILIAPPAVGFLSYLSLHGELNHFARILYYAGLFTTLLLATQLVRFIGIRFFLSWWAYSFPLAAITLATLTMYARLDLVFFKWLSVILFAVLNLVLLMLLVRTAVAVWRREICVEED